MLQWLLLLNLALFSHAFQTIAPLSARSSLLAVCGKSLPLAFGAALKQTPLAFGSVSTLRSSMATNLCDPATRDSRYSGNMAQYLVDLHDKKSVFNFWFVVLFCFVVVLCHKS